MAVAPLFVKDMPTLKTTLKLDGVATAGGLAAIDDAVANVRLQFYLRLGAGLIASVVAILDVDAPATNDELRRAAATRCELLWVRRFLIPVLSVAIIDGGSTTAETWNQEAAWRQSNKADLQAEMERLNTEIEKYLDFIKGAVGPGNEIAIRFETIEQDNKPDRPGGSVFPSLRNPKNWSRQEYPF